MTGRPLPVARRRFLGTMAVALGCGGLSGCASLFVSSPPAHLYRLSAVGDFSANLPHVNAQLRIDEPQAPAGIDTRRIALGRSPLSLDYYADAEWTDRVPALLEQILLASFENSNTVTAIQSGGVRADFVLQTEIRHFEAVYPASSGSGPPRIWVALMVRLISPSQREIVAQRLFERQVPAAANTVPAAVAAFDTATGAVIRDIVLWTATNPALSRTRR